MERAKSTLFVRKIHVWCGSSRKSLNFVVGSRTSRPVRGSRTQSLQRASRERTAWSALIFTFEPSHEVVFDMVLKSNTEAGHIRWDASKHSCRLTEWHGN